MSDRITEKRIRKELLRAAPDRNARRDVSNANLSDFFSILRALGTTTSEFMSALRQELKDQAEDKDKPARSAAGCLGQDGKERN